ncbi:hypothetical protein ISN44_As04g004690 [Arabidopsis suecica]|uniref:Uncharacterized protein n=1 Tax=Arabidopsis suecica TaxID=45249 RepID=A0A8T2E651_ARASU|nr:hypothetical protein ISN44_As04g004690 [Arabidopsis suecica]
MENGGAESSNGKEEQLESEISKKLEITKMVKRRTMEKKEAKLLHRLFLVCRDFGFQVFVEAKEQKYSLHSGGG